jgi:hypothetical protein
MKANFTRYLKDLEEDELRDELAMLYARFEQVRAYYKMELGGSTTAMVDKYKKKIKHCFLPGRGRGKRARSQSRDLIKEFKEISIFPADIVELELYRAGMMVEWMIHWYNESDAYFASVTKAYQIACRHIVDQQLEERLRPEAKLIAQRFENYRRRGGYSLLEIYVDVFGLSPKES